MFYKFRKGDMFINRLETHPKVEFFVNSGSVDSVYFNRDNKGLDSNGGDGFVAIGDFPIAIRVTLPPRLIITEGGDFIITEAGDIIETE